MSRDALVVGINQYQSLPILGAAAADAQSMAEILCRQGECRVTRVPEIIDTDKRLSVGDQMPVTTQFLETALVNLFKPQGVATTTLALFYFSGHGLQRQAGIREGYLATSDTNPDAGNFGVSLTWLRRLIDESPIKQIVVILDCCHSGEIFNFKEVNPGTQEGYSRLVIAASRAYEAAYESIDGTQSVLTQALLSGLDPCRVEKGQINNHSLVDWVSTQLKTEVQQPLFESSGGEIILTRAMGMKVPPVKPRLSTLARLRQMTFGFCPYRGLEPFSEKHADYFFGRNDLLESLLSNIRSSNLCALVGASSSGKTSLLRAGLIHQLKQGEQISGSETWTIKYLTPGQQSLRSLAAVFTQEDADEIVLATQLSQAETLLKDNDKGLAQLVTATLMQQNTAETGQFWLIIDQFEELLRPTTNAQVSAERHQFVRCLLTALTDPSLPFGLVIGLRADAMDGLLPYPDLLTRLEKSMVMMTPIPYDELKAVIMKPAEKMGLHVDPLLLHSLLLDLTGAPGELALLQQTLLELWRRRESSSVFNGTPRLTVDAYMSLGGVKNVLVSRANAVYEGLAEDEKAAAKRIFLSLCELGEGCDDNKRRAYKSELINPHFSEELINRTLEKLITARLVIVGQDSTSDFPRNGGMAMPDSAWVTQKTPASEIKRWFIRYGPMPTAGSPETIELTHKSLIDEWKQMRQWLNGQRQVIREQRRLEISAQEWLQRGRPNHPEYLLGGRCLKDAAFFFTNHHQTLSSLALEFVEASRRAHRRQWLKTIVLSLLVPLAMVAGMAVSFARNRLVPSRSTRTTTSLSTIHESLVRPHRAISRLLSQSMPIPTFVPSEGGQINLKQLATSESISLQLIDDENADDEAEPAADLGILAEDQETYMMKSVGQMPDPANPDKTIEFWVIHPHDIETHQIHPVLPTTIGGTALEE